MVVGLCVRLTITETPVFREAVTREIAPRCPSWWYSGNAPRTLVLGILVSLATFVLFYLVTVFALSWATTALGWPDDVPADSARRDRVLRGDDSAQRRPRRAAAGGR